MKDELEVIVQDLILINNCDYGELKIAKALKNSEETIRRVKGYGKENLLHPTRSMLKEELRKILKNDEDDSGIF